MCNSAGIHGLFWCFILHYKWSHKFLWYSVISQASQLPHWSHTHTHSSNKRHMDFTLCNRTVVFLKQRSASVVFCLNMKQKTDQNLIINWQFSFIVNYIIEMSNDFTLCDKAMSLMNATGVFSVEIILSETWISLHFHWIFIAFHFIVITKCQMIAQTWCSWRNYSGFLCTYYLDLIRIDL